LQVDDPRLVSYYNANPSKSVAESRDWAELRVAALNHALEASRRRKSAFTPATGINIGPRIHDLGLKDIADIMLRVNAGAYSFEGANPRHEHEWRVWETIKLPAGKILIPA
jgi:5-methyltetrahydropteroyltriglutamate--homocysteine methyltransferase